MELLPPEPEQQPAEGDVHLRVLLVELFHLEDLAEGDVSPAGERLAAVVFPGVVGALPPRLVLAKREAHHRARPRAEELAVEVRDHAQLVDVRTAGHAHNLGEFLFGELLHA